MNISPYLIEIVVCGYEIQFYTCNSISAADSTGTHSMYTTYKDYEIMFHVSSMLPYTPNNKQQVGKRQGSQFQHTGVFMSTKILQLFIYMNTNGHRCQNVGVDVA